MSGHEKGAERAERIRQWRERSAPSTGAVENNRAIYFAIVLGLLGGFMALGNGLAGSWWGVLGGLVVIAAIVPLLRSNRVRVETVAPGDRPSHLREMRWFLLCLGMVGLGVLLTIHPW